MASSLVTPSRTLRGLIVSACLAVTVPFGCTVDAVNPEGCHKIEEARCEGAPACPNLKVTDVAACKRFYRDQCLRGLSTTDDPGAPKVDKCVEKLRSCIAAGPDASCQGGLKTCEAVENPQFLAECVFLIPPAAAPTTTATTSATTTASQ